MFEGLTGPYRVISADPPWPIKWGGGKGGRRRRAVPLAYSLMSIESIEALPVGELADDDCVLFLWVTAALNRRGVGVRVLEAWGFKDAGEFVWEKPNFGMGAFPRQTHEVMLVGTRGRPRPKGPNDVRSVQRWGQSYDCNGGKLHSAKPDGALDLIESRFDGPYVELFARAPRLGWDHWGLGFESEAS